MQNPSCGFFTRAHDGIGIRSYFYLMRFIDIYQTKKLRSFNSLGIGRNKSITVTEQVPRRGPVGLVQILLGGSLEGSFHRFSSIALFESLDGSNRNKIHRQERWYRPNFMNYGSLKAPCM